MEVDILLSTYNSERFLEDLFFSLEQQTFQGWRLIIRDDGSTDRTIGLLLKYEEKFQERVLLLNNNGLNLGPKHSFAELLNHSTAEYIMFCDHDDYWLPYKIEISLKKLKEMEKKNQGKPALVCTDLTVTDKDLQITHPSLWKSSGINPENIKNIYRLIINNTVVGCTIIMNRKAKSISLPIPDEAVMHDWWIALKVAQNGNIEYIKESTLLYRQHQSNTIGANSIGKKYSQLGLAHFKTTFKNNIAAYKMFKALAPDFSIFKLIGYKIIITFSRITNS